MRFLVLVIASLASFPALAQPKDTIYLRAQTLDAVNIYKDKYAYWREVERVRKVYPYALHAAELLDKFEEELGVIDSRRKKKKYGKTAHKMLKSDYNYVIRDLYRSEGVLLMKLIHRETGLTAAQIIKRYRGRFNSEVYDQIGKIWDQDLDVKYDPKGVDWLTEQVILEIQNEVLEFTPDAKMVTKEEYKENMKEYREARKEYKQHQKEVKKQEKQQKRAASKK